MTTTRRTARRADPFRPTPVALAVSMALGFLPTATLAQSNAALPVGCAATPTACGGRAFDPSKAGNAPVLTAPNLLTVNQGTATSAIYNWQSFNIGKGNTVQFLQSGPNAVALNRIFDNNTSTIDGALKANGQIYLLNPNGIIFGGNARIDVGGLIASTLNTADSRVTRGLLTETSDKAVFFKDPDFAATAGVADAGTIRVLPGAQLYAAGRDEKGTIVSAGRIFLFAPDVANGGDIKVDGGGQVILAAGNKVYLGSTTDTTLRGLLVEVADGVKVENGGTISTTRGNITMMGLAVKQAGTLTATSAIRENGSIRLIARETSAAPDRNLNPVDTLSAAAKTGVVDIVSGSNTRVVLDSSDAGTAALNDSNAAAARSRINIEGGAVNIGVDAGAAVGVARVEARGGDITIAARADVSTAAYAVGDTSVSKPALLGQENASAIVNLGSNAVIDASGLTGVNVDGSRNFIYIERLTSTDMRDTPLQRDGFLRGQGVYMNVALDHAFIDNSGRRAAVAGTQAERNAAGGNVALRAEGAVNVAQGAVVDVSGGSAVTSAGVGRTSQLITASGRVVDIGNASATQVYTGFADKVVVAISSPDEGIEVSKTYEAPKISAVGGFTSGTAAGSVEITAPRGLLQGTLLARTSVQPQQGSAPPAGGELRIGSANNGQTLDQQTYLQRASVILGNDAAALRGGLTEAQQARSIVVDTDQLRGNGFSRFNVVSDGRIEQAARSALDLGVGGEFSAQGNQVAVNSNITASGGRIFIAERPVTDTLDSSPSSPRRDELAGELALSPLRGSVSVASGVQLSTAGRWTNESRLPPSQAGQQALALNGGSIAVSGRNVDVSNASFDVSAGAAATVGGSVRGGTGGNLSLGAVSTDTASPARLNLGDGFAERIAGFGVSSSGSLAITAPDALVLAGTAPASGTATWLDTTTLGTRGFTNYSFSAPNIVTVAAGTTFRPETRVLLPTAALSAAASSARLLDVLQAQLVLPTQQKPAQITLRTTNLVGGTTAVEAGAVVDAGVQGKLTVTGGQRTQVDGSLIARAGSVAVGLAERGSTSLTAAQFADRVTEIGASGRIDVSGISRVVAAIDGRRSGDVLDAGRVDLSAAAGTLNVASGALISARGALDQVTPRGEAAASQTVASAGGTVTLSGDQGLFIGQNDSQSVIDAHGGDASANGGRLSVRLKLADVLDNAAFPDAAANLKLPRQLQIDTTAATVPAAGAPFDAATYAGKGQVTTALINDSGFDQVWLASSNAISFGHEGSAAAAPRVELATRGLLSLEARQIVGLGNSTLALDAPYVSIGSGKASVAGAAASPGPRGVVATSGLASLEVKARDIDLVGNIALQGIGQATLAARADLRGQYVALGDDGSASARFSVGGNLRIEAAQVSPATLTNFTLESTAPLDAVGEGRIVIARPAADTGKPLAPLSAGGQLMVKANDIQIDGRLTAPFGAIDLQGARSVVASRTAELSVAGQGVVPFGSVASGARWTYSGGGAPVDVASATAVNLPDKSVRISAPTVDLQAGSSVDVSGGGHLLATEFVAGPGGSFDVTKNFPELRNGVALRNALFALLPSRGTAIAAYDPQMYVGDTTGGLNLNGAAADAGVFRIGQTITIAAGSGIPAGTYTVLPAGYAVLPGAYALQPVSGTTDLLPGTVVNEAAGTVVVAGKLGFADAGTQASRWSGYRVYNGAQFRKLAELKEYDGDVFTAPFASALGVSQRLAKDAGALAIGADSLRLAGNFKTAAASGGRGVDASISAPHIEVSDAAVAAAGAPSDTLTLAAAQLNDWKAETLVLGAVATRSSTDDATLDLMRPAQSVTLLGAASVRAGEVILAASDTVSTGIGAAVESTSAAPATRQLNASGDGALLWVSASNSEALGFTRSGASLPADDTTKGTLALGIGTTLAGANGAARRAGNVVFDGTRAQTYGSGLDIRADAISLSGSTVNIGDVPVGTAGLNIDAALLAALGSASRLTLTSAGGFSSFGTAAIGGSDAGGQPTLDLLRLRGQGIQGTGSETDSVILTARNIVLDNSGAATLGAPTDGTGSGTLQVRALRDAAAPQRTGNIGVAGSFASSGFGTTVLEAGSDLRFTGAVAATSAYDAGSAKLDVDAARITADRGVHAVLRTTGNLAVTASGTAPVARTQEAGATLALSAAAVDFGGRISLPGGVVAINATGSAAADNITLRSGSVIDAAGQTQRFGPSGGATTADLSAGAVSLHSAAGSVLAQSGSVIDLAGAGRDGDAGSLDIGAAAGAARLQGELRIAPGSAARGAEVAIDAKTLANLAEIAAALNSGSANTAAQSIDLRAREGDLVVGTSDTLRAARITLAADGGAGPSDGSVRIAGRLEANGAATGAGNGGRVQAYARNQIEVSGTIDAHARALGDGVADGGQVSLSARITNDAAAPQGLDAVVLQSSARIDVAGRSSSTQQAVDGQVTLRARSVGDNDVAVAFLPGGVVKGGKTIVEGVVLQELTGNQTLTTLAAQQAQLQAYMSNANRAAMTARLTAGGLPADALSLRAGLEIRTPGNLTLNSELNFASKAADGSYNWRYGGSDLATSAPGALTLRAGGNLALNESISDGFASAATSAAVFATGDSWRYAFTAGSDLSAANARQTAATGVGTLSVGKTTDSTVLGAVIRTGTGSISMDAARDVVLQNNSASLTSTRQGQVVYTAGVQVPVTEIANGTFPTPRAAINPVLTSGGGDLDVRAGGDINGASQNDSIGSTQSVSEWLWRGGLGTDASPSVQWVNFSQFQQGLGALGGGNLTLRAQGDISRVGASVASTGYVAGAVLRNYSSGDLDVRAEGAVKQGIYYAEAGNFDLRAARMLGNGDGNFTGTTRLAQGSNSVDVQVREQAELSAPFNPTAYAPAKLMFPANATDDYRTTYFTYAPDSRFSARVAAGDLSVSSVSAAVSTQLQTDANRNVFAPYVAPSVDLVAFGGGLTSNTLQLSPAAAGNLKVLADGDIRSLSVVMSQADPAQVPSAAAPLRYGSSVEDTASLALRVTAPLASAVALHATDTEPSSVVSRTGSIGGLQLDLAEATEIHAAGSLSNVVQIQLQNQSPASISRISAGGGIDASNASDSIRIYGPGAAEIVSGGPLTLSAGGESLGLVSRGNFANPNLPAQGASLIVAAGTGRGADAYAQRPDYRNLVTEFLRHDAFASAGAGAAALNDEVLALLGKSGNEAGALELAAVLKAGLAGRGAIDEPGSTVSTQLAALSPASLAVGAARLASAVQEVANTRFVQTRNTDTFAAGYAVFNDLFPTLATGGAALRSFVASNPFAASGDAAALRAQVIASLRQQGGAAAAVAGALALGLANPTSIDDPTSGYATAVAALAADQLQSGARALLSQTLTVAGSDLDKLRAAGRFDAAAGTPYAKALTDLAAAYAAQGVPGLNDIGMASNQIKVEQTGQLSLFAPRGGVLVGQPVATLSTKGADELGLFTLGGGTLMAMARDNVDVYRSRIFTVAGGDIALWSSLANIDAGRGKTDAAVVPPPRLVLDPKTGVAKLDIGGAVTGSGIGALVSQPNQAPSDVTLIAPKGFIDAGEAGIRADRGRVTLGADVVLNTGSIKASSGVSGGKVVVAPPPPVPATSSGNQASEAVEQTQRNLTTQQTEAEERAKKERRKRVTGEFIGFGDD